ncbi:MAG: NRDE family protein, partial [Spongiibacteraceae bacterium]
MCLVLFSLQQHADYPLIVAANRDELYERPTQAAHFWEQYPGLFAGRDLRAGGTWMGITNTGRFAAVTNFREIA